VRGQVTDGSVLEIQAAVAHSDIAVKLLVSRVFVSPLHNLLVGTPPPLYRESVDFHCEALLTKRDTLAI